MQPEWDRQTADGAKPAVKLGDQHRDEGFCFLCLLFERGNLLLRIVELSLQLLDLFVALRDLALEPLDLLGGSRGGCAGRQDDRGLVAALLWMGPQS